MDIEKLNRLYFIYTEYWMMLWDNFMDDHKREVYSNKYHKYWSISMDEWYKKINQNKDDIR